MQESKSKKIIEKRIFGIHTDVNRKQFEKLFEDMKSVFDIQKYIYIAEMDVDTSAITYYEYDMDITEDLK